MNRREEIILASTKVIGNEGIKSFTIKKLAMNLPLTEGAIYRHFKSKEEILLAIFDHFSLIIEKKITTVLDENLNPRENIFEFFNSLKQIFKENPELIYLFFSEGTFIDIPALTTKTLQMMDTKIKIISDLLIKGQKTGDINFEIPVQEFAKMILGYFRLSVMKIKLKGESDNIEIRLGEFFNALKKII